MQHTNLARTQALTLTQPERKERNSFIGRSPVSCQCAQAEAQQEDGRSAIGHFKISSANSLRVAKSIGASAPSHGSGSFHSS